MKPLWSLRGCSRRHRGRFVEPSRSFGATGNSSNNDRPYHFIRELVERKVFSVQFTESSGQHEETLTKPLGLEAFVKHRAFLMNLPEC